MYIKTIEFEAKYIPEILAGKKTTTIRPNGYEIFEPDDLIVMIEEQTGKPFAIARIVSIEHKPFTDFSAQDKLESGHEQDFEGFAQNFQKKFHKALQPETPVALVTFLIVDDGQKREHEAEQEEQKEDQEEQNTEE